MALSQIGLTVCFRGEGD